MWHPMDLATRTPLCHPPGEQLLAVVGNIVTCQRRNCNLSLSLPSLSREYTLLHRIKNGNPGRLNKSDSDRMVIAACVAGGFSCKDDVIEDLFSVLRLGQHCSLIGDFREYGSQNSGSCRSSRLGDRGGGRAVEEILLALRQTSPKPSTLLGRRGTKEKDRPYWRVSYLHAFSSGLPFYASL